MDLERLREQEAAAHAAFLQACQAVLDAAEAIRANANDISRAGAQPLELLHLGDALSGAKQVLDRAAYQARRANHPAEKAAIKARQKLGKTYVLK